MTDIDKYLSFVLTMFVAFGVTFQVPVQSLFWCVGNGDHYSTQGNSPLRDSRRICRRCHLYPADVVSQFMLAMPLWLLYEAGIVVAGWTVKK